MKVIGAADVGAAAATTNALSAKIQREPIEKLLKIMSLFLLKEVEGLLKKERV